MIYKLTNETNDNKLFFKLFMLMDLPMIAIAACLLLANIALTIIAAVVGVGLVVAFIASIFLSRRTITTLQVATQYLNEIAGGNLQVAIDTTHHESGKILGALKSMQTYMCSVVNDAHKVNQLGIGLEMGLNSSIIGVTFSNSENNLQYMNQAAKDIWQGMSAGVKTHHQDFTVKAMLGKKLASFFENDVVRKAFTQQLTAPKVINIEMYEHHLELTLIPIYNDKDEYLGRMTQWVNQTAEKAAEKEITRLVDEAVAGHLSARVNLSTLPAGFILDTGKNINALLDAVITPLNMTANYIERISKGDIPPKITTHYHGEFNTIKNNLNQCIDTINTLIADMNNMSAQHDLGDIDVNIDPDKFDGAYQVMAQGVNQMVNGHLAVNKQAMTCIKGFGEGDFSASMAQLPGKKAFINDTIEQVRRDLQALSRDANMLADAAANGHITVRADASQHHGDFRQIIEGVNNTLDMIVKPILTVKEAVETISTAAGEISAGNSDLSIRTEKQASSLEETAASLEELASTVRHNANSAKQANQLAITASEVAINGGKVVEQVISTMANINESAKKIEDIISVIDGIAFQTNILALNAAVEAARAGEQGRGFAVVAGEVGNLAQRSASAAKEIKVLIHDSVSKTAEGSVHVENAGRTMGEVVSSVKRVTDIIGEIAAASLEQSSGIEQVNTSVTIIDEVTQQNSALVEQAAAAAESLLDQANTLSNTVSIFKVGNESFGVGLSTSQRWQ